MVRFVSVLLVIAGLLLSCVLVSALLPAPSTTPPAPGDTVPVATATPTQPPAPEPTEVVSSNVSLPAVYKASTVNMPAVYKLPSPPPPSPAYTDLGTLGGLYSFANDINNRGQVVGNSSVSANEPTAADGHAFLWQQGKMSDLGTLGGKNSSASCINEQGQIAGNSEYGAGSVSHAFFWANGHMTDLGTLGGDWSMATGLNDLGEVIGISKTAGGDLHCFVWAAGVMTDLGTPGGGSCNAVDINNRGQIVGDITSPFAGGGYITHAFLWENGVMTDLTPGYKLGEYGTARAINEGGQVVTFRLDISSGNCIAGCVILWDNGSTIDLWSGGQGLSREAINDWGQVVGYGDYHTSKLADGPPWDALLWDNGSVINLGLLEGSSPNNQSLLNNRGQIVLGRGGQLYLWYDGTLIPFASPPEARVYAIAINDAGAVAGGSSATNAYFGHALLWQVVTTAE